MNIQVHEHQSTFIVSLVMGAFLNWIAFRWGFFNIPKSSEESSQTAIRFLDVAGIFALYLALQVLVPPFIAFFVYSFREGYPITGSLLPYITDYAHGWFNLLSILAGAGGVLFGLSRLKSEKVNELWGKRTSFWENIRFGSLAWIMSFPLAVAVGELAWMGMNLFFGIDAHLEQVAIKHLNRVSVYPVLFSLTIGSVIFIAPVVEEILFRGLLQSWMATKVGTPMGIVLTSLIFSLFHCASSQGMANVILMSSLFVLSCFLGFVYVRQRSLWASIGLHVTFNSISVIMLLVK